SELIGIATRKSQVLPTSRDNPRPSEPTTTTSGATATSRSYSPVGASASRPTTTYPSCWHAFSARVRLVTRDTGNRAAAPALVRQAVAVMPAARRFGTNTPWAPNAAAERITAPRLRGSVTPSSATSSGGSGCSEAAASRSSNGRYEYGGTWSPIPWCSAPPESRSSSDRLTSRIASPRSLAVRTLSLTRSSMSIPYATYSAVAGIRARSASTTGLRPTSSSGPSWEARLPAPDRLSAARAALEPGPGRPTFGGRPFSAAARRSRSCLRAVPRGTSSPEYALCQGRSSAGRVRPLPPRRRPLGGVSTGLPERPRALPAIDCPPRATRSVFDHHADLLQLVPNRVRRGVVLPFPGRLPLLQRQGHQRVHHRPQLPAVPGRPGRIQRVDPEHVQHPPDTGQRPPQPVVVPLGVGGVALPDHLLHR